MMKKSTKIRNSLWAVALFSLYGCGDHSSADTSSREPDKPPFVLNSFSATIKTGDTYTSNLEAYLQDLGDKNWKIKSITESKGLISTPVISKDRKHFSFTAQHAGITTIRWSIEANGKLYASDMVIGIQQITTENSSPVADKISIEATVNKSVVIDLSDYVHDADSDTLTLAAFAQSSNRFSHDGFRVTYNPNSYVGHDVATFAVSDGKGGVVTDTISVTVNDPNSSNHPPAIRAYSRTVNEGESMTITLPEIASDQDKDPLTIIGLYAASGRASIDKSRKSITYSSGHFSGKDSFVYVVKDKHGASSQGVATINVKPKDKSIKASPITSDLTVGTLKTLSVTAGVDFDGKWKLSKVVSSNGLVEIHDIAGDSFQVKGLSSGVDTLKYTVKSEDEAQSSVSSILIAVSDPNNHSPSIKPLVLTTNSRKPITIDDLLSSNKYDEDHDALSISNLIPFRVDAKFELTGDKLTYNPDGYIGVDNATYTVSDGRGGYAVGLITVNVTDATPSNQLPTAQDVLLETDSESTLRYDLTSIAHDADDENLAITLINPNPRCEIFGSEFIYDPDDFIGVDSIVYKVNDGRGGVDTGVITVVVSDGNEHAPTAKSYNADITINDILVNPSTPMSFDVHALGLVGDKDGDEVTVSEVSGALSEVKLKPSGLIEYMPSPNIEHDKFTYFVSDGHGGVAHNDIVVNVTNHAPEVESISASLNPLDLSGNSMSIELAPNVRDIDTDLDSLIITLDPNHRASNDVKRRFGDLKNFSLNYDPTAAGYTFEGLDSIEYSVSDGYKSNTGEINVTSVIPTIEFNLEDETLSPVDVNSDAITVDIEDLINSSSSISDMNLVSVGNEQFGIVSNIKGLKFDYQPKTNTYGRDILEYIVSDKEDRYSKANIIVDIKEPAAPAIDSVKLEYKDGFLASVECSACELSTVDYHFSLDGMPIPGADTNVSNRFLRLSHSDLDKTINLDVKVKNSFCGTPSGNACKTTEKTITGRIAYVKAMNKNTQASAALKNDGTVVAWGNANNGGLAPSNLTDVKKIYGNDFAFVALKNDSTIVAWGSALRGGLAPSNLTNVKAIYSNDVAFAALKNDGTVVAWGDDNNGGSAPSGLTRVKEIYSNSDAFAALKNDGTVVAWGNANNGGLAPSNLADVKEIYSNDFAFAALKNDGTVVAWGRASNGGSAPSTLADVKAIYSNDFAFAALKNDGTVVAWGDANYGGLAPSNLTDVKAIYSTNFAFAALKNDGTIVAWGNAHNGGSAPSGLTHVKAIYSNDVAFAALKTDDTVVAWGDDNNGGSAPSGLTRVKVIYSTDFAFAALKNDGTVVAWGGASNGGTTPSDLADVRTIYDLGSAFAAVKNNGSIVIWGDTNDIYPPNATQPIFKAIY